MTAGERPPSYRDFRHRGAGSARLARSCIEPQRRRDLDSGAPA